MRVWPRLPPELANESDDPVDAVRRSIASVRAKANHNEKVTRITAGAIIVSSALIPLCLVISESGGEFFWGKLAPGILAVISAAAAGINQFERPQERWKFYRGYQRRLEDELLRFQAGIEPYDDPALPARSKRLVANLSAIRMGLHHDWSGLLPATAAAPEHTSSTDE